MRVNTGVLCLVFLRLNDKKATHCQAASIKLRAAVANLPVADRLLATSSFIYRYNPTKLKTIAEQRIFNQSLFGEWAQSSTFLINHPSESGNTECLSMNIYIEQVILANSYPIILLFVYFQTPVKQNLSHQMDLYVKI